MFSAASTEATSFEQPWLEKYRPEHVKDIVGNEETVGRLEVLAQQGNMPNLILAGPPGTGKTTSVLALARSLLGDAFKEGVLELNASDDRGIEVVRGRIKAFAQKKVTLPPGRHKIIVLDEADAMTEGAQQAMRRTMEIYSSTTRFALACNLSEKIIEPIQSRCAVLRYSKLTEQQVTKRLLDVLEMEKATYNESGLEALVFTAEGDMRQVRLALSSSSTSSPLSPVHVHPVLLRSSLRSLRRETQPRLSRCRSPALAFVLTLYVRAGAQQRPSDIRRLWLHFERKRLQGVRPAASSAHQEGPRQLCARRL